MCSIASLTIVIAYSLTLADSQSHLTQYQGANRVSAYNGIPERSRQVNLATSLKCHVREYTYKALRRDDFGRSCWQYITINSCWGRCDSSEIPDWKFPFKQSFHPVCIHYKKRIKRIKLRNCDPEVDEELRNYYFIEAVQCRCSLCRSSQAVCESLALEPANQVVDPVIKPAQYANGQARQEEEVNNL